MPFTFAHPAIVLPFGTIWKRYFSLTALFVGSMTPDFEYFLRLKVRSEYSHTIFGVFWFDLPLGIILCFIFHLFVKKPLFQNLPHFLQTRFKQFINFDFTSYFRYNYVVVIFSVLLGAFSHLFWDAFTHHDGFFVEQFSILQTKSRQEVISVFSIPIFSFPLYKFLQHFSTFVGGITILFWIYKLPKNLEVVCPVSLSYWLSVVGIFVLLFSLRILFMSHLHIGNFIVSGIAFMMLSLILVGLFYKNR
ncbi:DUF4184 family protein [Bernardetia sp.]|uniref:DUF4184 family protein n=1 Tax=Bernardetia sp. TaxID=1937974 RepID=UPI0025C345F2|nr:DUF4184 family protein [Bernardetia sp.]